jgi:hypothetical protein
LLDIVRIIKSRIMRWTAHAAYMSWKGGRGIYRIEVESVRKETTRKTIDIR